MRDFLSKSEAKRFVYMWARHMEDYEERIRTEEAEKEQAEIRHEADTRLVQIAYTLWRNL